MLISERVNTDDNNLLILEELESRRGVVRDIHICNFHVFKINVL